MKTFKLLFGLTFILLLGACSDSTEDDLGLSGDGTLTAKVDGANFQSLSIAVGASVTNGIAAIQGSNADGEYIRINLANYNGIGTYTTGNALSNVNSISYGTVSPVAAWMSTFDLGTGTIEITEETDSSISGTFSFTGVNSSDGNSTKAITQGVFNAPKN